MKGPCKNCPDRYPGCHGKCDKYIEYDKYNKEVQKKRMEHKQLNDVLYSLNHTRYTDLKRNHK